MASESSRVSYAGAGWGCSISRTLRTLWNEQCGLEDPGKALNRPDLPPRSEWSRLPWPQHLLKSAAEVADTPFRERPQFSWLQPVNVWQSRNDQIAKRLHDPINDERRRWVAALKPGPPDRGDFVVDRSDLDSVKFLVLGDSGEGDMSQYSLVRPMLERGSDTDFIFVCSDVIYPAGSINQYAEKFYCPYSGYTKPIYAIPGNHDWYDNLVGFMHHFCNLEASERPPSGTQARPSVREWISRKLWRKEEKKDEERVARGRALRSSPEQRSNQPGPYFVIDTGPLRIVGIDAGITNKLDCAQGRWLRRVSSETSKPKILITGFPIYVNGEYVPGCIEGGGTVDEIVCVPKHNYVAVIGGDTHNYQRYTVTVGDRTIHYIVSGGGGAYLSPTHTIPKIEADRLRSLGSPGEVDEERFRCYPLRGDSLCYYSRLYEETEVVSWLRNKLRHNKLISSLPLPLSERTLRFEMSPGEASALMSEQLGIQATREVDREVPVSEEAKRAAKKIFRGHEVLPLPGPGSIPALHSLYYAYLPWANPPFFNSFLRMQATTDRLTVTCYGVTGCEEHQKDPPVEDEVEIPLAG